MRLGTEVPFALCVTCVLLHFYHYCCMCAAHLVTIAAVVCSSVQGRCAIASTSCGCEPCLVFVSSVRGPVWSCATASLYHDSAVPETGLGFLGLFELEN